MSRIIKKDAPATEETIVTANAHDLPIVDISAEIPKLSSEERTLRDDFAIAALQATCNDNDWISADQMADWCYKQADAMMKARDK